MLRAMLRAMLRSMPGPGLGRPFPGPAWPVPAWAGKSIFRGRLLSKFLPWLFRENLVTVLGFEAGPTSNATWAATWIMLALP